MCDIYLADNSQAMADDDSWLYGEDNDEVEEPEAATEEVEAVKGEIFLISFFSFNSKL